MKKKKLIICLLAVIIVGLIALIIYLNKEPKSESDNMDNSVSEVEYTCSFTKTYMVSALGTIDIKEEIPGMEPVGLKQFQNDELITAIMPTEVVDKLETGKYYEFTYTITGKDKEINTMDDINAYFSSTENNDNFKITIDVNETDNQGLDQIQESICSNQ